MYAFTLWGRKYYPIISLMIGLLFGIFIATVVTRWFGDEIIIYAENTKKQTIEQQYNSLELFQQICMLREKQLGTLALLSLSSLAVMIQIIFFVAIGMIGGFLLAIYTYGLGNIGILFFCILLFPHVFAYGFVFYSIVKQAEQIRRQLSLCKRRQWFEPLKITVTYIIVIVTMICGCALMEAILSPVMIKLFGIITIE